MGVLNLALRRAVQPTSKTVAALHNMPTKPTGHRPSQGQLDAQATRWVMASIKKYMSQETCRTQGNRPEHLQQMLDSVCGMLTAFGPPDKGLTAAVMRVTGIRKNQWNRGCTLQDDAAPLNLSAKKNTGLKRRRAPQSFGPKQKRNMRWVYDWFHEHCDLVTPDKSRPAKLKGVRVRKTIGDEVIRVECVPHIRTGHKKDLVDNFFKSDAYRLWQKENEGDALSERAVQHCICPCIKTSAVNECACRICTEFGHALEAWHLQRKKWHTKTKCKCKGCRDPAKFEVFQQASENPSTFRAAVCCAKKKYPHLTLPHQPGIVPEFYELKCCKEAESTPGHVAQCEECGVEKRLYR